MPTEIPSREPARRVVSLVPSMTETVAALGMAARLVGVTDFCVVGAPPEARRVGGTKNPSVADVLTLAPDLVLANREENRREDVEALRAAGVPVWVSFPRRVADVGPMLAELGARVGAEAAAARLVAELDAARARALAAAPAPRPRCLTLVWRKPWMAAGADTFVDDLLRCAGFDNAVVEARYPRLGGERAGGGAAFRDLDAVLLPDEPYAFGPDDLPALRTWLGVDAEAARPAPVFVDGRLLTWHGPSTARALGDLSALVVRLAAH